MSEEKEIRQNIDDDIDQSAFKEMLNKCMINIVVDKTIVAKMPNGDYSAFEMLKVKSPEEYAREFIYSYGDPSQTVDECLLEMDRRTGEPHEETIENYLCELGYKLYLEAKIRGNVNSKSTEKERL